MKSAIQLPEGASWEEDAVPNIQLPEGAKWERNPVGTLRGIYDLGKDLVGGAISSTGALARGAAEATRNVAPVGNTLRNIADITTGMGDKLSQSTSPEYQEAKRTSQFEGDILSPSTWKGGEDPSLIGFAGQAANTIGQAAPTVAAAILSRGKLAPTAVAGAATTAGASAKQEEDRLLQMDQAQLDQVPKYQDLLKTMSPDAARKALAAEAGSTAALYSAPLGALDAFTEGLPFLNAGKKILANAATTRLGRAAVGAGLGAAGEGLQEVGENAAAIAGSRAVTGEKRSLTEDSLPNFVGGVLGGGPIGAVGGALSPDMPVESPKNATDVLDQLARGKVSTESLDSLIPNTPGEAQNQEVVTEIPAAPPPVTPPPTLSNSTGLEPTQQEEVPAPAPHPITGVIPPASQPSPEAVKAVVGFVPDPARGPLSRAINTAVNTGAIPVSETPSIIVPPASNVRETMKVMDRLRPTENPNENLASPQNPASLGPPVGTTPSDVSAPAISPAIPSTKPDIGIPTSEQKQEVKKEETQYEERLSKLGTPFKSEVGAKAAARANPGFEVFKRAGKEWILRRPITPTVNESVPRVQVSAPEPITPSIPTEQVTPTVGEPPATAIPSEIPNEEIQGQQQGQGERQGLLNPPPSDAVDTGGVTLQNRDRGRASSIQQMQAIANKPDPSRLSFSRDPNTGAPMTFVAGDSPIISDVDKGKADTVTMANGRKVPVQYAVVEADSVLASNLADGSSNQDYSAPTQPGQIRALNNGRTAGIQTAYQRGTTEEYIKGLIDDAVVHGVSEQAIRSKKKPMLVRVYPESFNTGDMGAESNMSQSLGLSASEQADTDARALPDLSGLAATEDGDLLSTANNQFIRGWLSALGQTESAKLMDAEGKPTRQMVDRLKSAIFSKAYGDPRLTSAMAEEANPEMKNVLAALTQASAEFARVDRAGPLGTITGQLASAVEIMREAKARGLTVQGLIDQADMFTARDAVADVLAKRIADNARSPKRLGELFREMARFALAEQEASTTADIFGRAPMSYNDVIASWDRLQERLNEQSKPKISTSLFNAAGRPSAQSTSTTTDRGGNDGTVRQSRRESEFAGRERTETQVTSRATEKLSKGSLKADVLRRLYDPITQGWKTTINVVNTPMDFPESIRKADGFDPKLSEAAIVGHQIYIAASRVETVRDAYRLLAHEGIAHAGVEGMVGAKQWPSLVKDINQLLDKGRVKELTEELARRYPDASVEVRAAEAIALMAERGVRNTPMSRLIGAARKFIRSLGVKLEFTESDLRGMIADAARKMLSTQGVSTRFSMAWHGTPHDFDEFSLGRMGTGEGAQAYGWGLYFAGNKDVADFYRKSLSGKSPKFTGEVSSELKAALEDVDLLGFDTIGQAISAIRSNTDWAERWDMTQQQKDALEKAFREHEKAAYEGQGKLYQVDLAPKEDEYLYWDKPLSEQSEKVRAALSAFDQNKTGSEIYADITRKNVQPYVDKGVEVLDFDKGQKGASKFLSWRGIPGIKYLDGTSRGKGEGAYNYVIFDDSLVKVQAKFSNRKAEENTVDVDGVSRTRTNSNGQPLAETDESLRNFWRWFGDSKVVDNQGRPLVVYHGTNAKFTIFNYGKPEGIGREKQIAGIYFAKNQHIANKYADIAANLSGRQNSKNVVSSYVLLKHPKKFVGSGGYTQMSKTTKENLTKDGFDGLIRYNDDGDIIELAALSPAQIKSATSNTGAFDLANPDIRFSNKPMPWDKAKEILSDKAADWRPGWLKFLTRQQIIDVGKDQFGGEHGLAAEYERIARRMEADAAQELSRPIKEGRRSATDTARAWAKMLSPFTKDGRAKGAALASLMNDATMSEIDPSKGYADGDDKNTYDTLRRRWDALGKEAQDIYLDARDAYSARRKAFYEALKERIEQSTEDGKAKAVMLDKLRQQYESGWVKGVYFPLARFGDYYVVAENSDGAREFVMVESQKEQRQKSRELSAAGYKVRVGKSIKALATDMAPSASFIGDIAQLIDKQKIDGDIDNSAADALKDGLFQMYLQSLPEQSVRKNFIHRKGTPGFSQDALRAFAHQMGHGAKQLARLRHAHNMAESIRQMKEMATQAPDPNKAADVVKALDDSFKWTMNPENAGWANKLTSLGFTWYLGMSPAAALVNTTQLAVVTLPNLAAQYGWGKATVALAKASTDYLRTAFNKPARATLEAEFNGDMGKMLEEMENSGAVDRTMTMSVMGLTDDNAAIATGTSAVMEKIGWAFHQTEKLNRESTAIAAYRLARADGKNHETGIRHAYDAIFQTHFDYSSSNRAKFMQGNVARVALLFRQYSQNISYYLVRNLHQMMKGDSKEIRRAAATRLFGTLGATFGLAGVAGLPGYSMAIAAANMLNAMFGDDDEPFDPEVELRKLMAKATGSNEGGETVTKGIANRLTGLEIAGRTGMGELWVRSPDMDLEGKELYFHYLEQLAGPVAGIVGGSFRGAQSIAEGNIQRGAEAMLPKFVKDYSKALRFGKEGATTKRGDPIINDFNAFELFAQSQGFTPARYSEQMDKNAKLKNMEQAVLDRRQSLTNLWVNAHKRGDTTGKSEALTLIRQFNQRWPAKAIRFDTLRSSLMTRARFSQRAVAGIGLDPKLSKELMQLADY